MPGPVRRSPYFRFFWNLRVTFSCVNEQDVQRCAAARPTPNVIQPTADGVRSGGTLPSRLLVGANDYESHARTCPALTQFRLFCDLTVEFSFLNWHVLRRWAAARPTQNLIQPTASSVRSGGTLHSRLLGGSNDHESHARTCPPGMLPRLFRNLTVTFSFLNGQDVQRWAAARPTPNVIQPTADSVWSGGTLPSRLLGAQLITNRMPGPVQRSLNFGCFAIFRSNFPF